MSSSVTLGSRFETLSISTNITSLPRCHKAPYDAKPTFDIGYAQDRGWVIKNCFMIVRLHLAIQQYNTEQGVSAQAFLLAFVLQSIEFERDIKF